MEWSCKKLTYLTIYQGVPTANNLGLQMNFLGRVVNSVIRIRCMFEIIVAMEMLEPLMNK